MGLVGIFLKCEYYYELHKRGLWRRNLLLNILLLKRNTYKITVLVFESFLFWNDNMLLFKAYYFKMILYVTILEVTYVLNEYRINISNYINEKKNKLAFFL